MSCLLLVYFGYQFYVFLAMCVYIFLTLFCFSCWCFVCYFILLLLIHCAFHIMHYYPTSLPLLWVLPLPSQHPYLLLLNKIKFKGKAETQTKLRNKREIKTNNSNNKRILSWKRSVVF